MLFIACEHENKEVAELLIKYGSEVNKVNFFGLTALIRACDLGTLEIVKLLLQYNASLTIADAVCFLIEMCLMQNGWSAIHFAARNGDVNVIQALLDSNKDVLFATTADGSTALHVAAHHDKVEACELLLNLGANPNAQLKSGWTPLIVASYDGLPQVVSVLLDYGANPEIRDEAKSSALQYAMEFNHFDVIYKLNSAKKIDPPAASVKRISGGICAIM